MRHTEPQQINPFARIGTTPAPDHDGKYTKESFVTGQVPSCFHETRTTLPERTQSERQRGSGNEQEKLLMGIPSENVCKEKYN